MPRRACPDCREELDPIKLMVGVAQVYYTPLTEERDFWTGGYRNAGTLSSWKCPRCGLIRAYADTEQDELPLPAEAPEPNAAALPLPSDPPEPDPAKLPLPAAGPDS